MNKFFYPRIAAQNIKKNGRFYFPYLLTIIGTVAAFYICGALANADDLPRTTRYAYLSSFMTIGLIVVAIFSVIFLFYTNSFLIKRRRKELGLYNVLGMDKGNIAVMLGFETIYIAVIGIGGGISFGILAQKLIGMLIRRVMNYSNGFGFYISADSIIASLIFFGAILLLTYLHDLRRISVQKPVELLRDGNVGEKEPKTRWLLTIFGILTLGSGYAIAIYTRNAVEAIGVYMIAVILVIIGTYCLFTACSITVLKLLRKNKKFYYKTRNFISVSGMIYRMKRNAVGLANICILSCMVLVMVSGTLSLFAGTQDMLDRRFPSDMQVELAYMPNIDDFDADSTKAKIIGIANDSGMTVSDTISFEYLGFALAQVDGVFITNVNHAGYIASQARMMCFLTLDGYRSMSGDNSVTSLESNEAMIYSRGFKDDSLTFNFNAENSDDILKTMRLDIVKHIENEIVVREYASYVTDVYYVVVSDSTVLNQLWQAQRDSYAGNASFMRWNLSFNLSGNDNEQKALADRLNASEIIGNDTPENSSMWFMTFCRAVESIDAYSMNGGFFFLGIFLGVIFIMATVLIIYYKQISEGYEDCERFRIMQQVGLPKDEIKRSVNGQILTVFFMPLIVAAIHVAFDFPILSLLLTLFQLTNISLTLLCTCATFLVFVAIYIVIYLLTAKVYYKIVE